jgi:hypothetical protein
MTPVAGAMVSPGGSAPASMDQVPARPSAVATVAEYGVPTAPLGRVVVAIWGLVALLRTRTVRVLLVPLELSPLAGAMTRRKETPGSENRTWVA